MTERAFTATGWLEESEAAIVIPFDESTFEAHTEFVGLLAASIPFDHVLGHIGRIAQRRIAALFAVCAAPSARVTSTVEIVGAGAVPGVARDAFSDEALANLIVG
jgi:hypothetical protein